MTTAAEPRYTLDEFQRMLDRPIEDRSYQLTRLGPIVVQHLAWKSLAGRSDRTLDDYERTLARLCTMYPGRHLHEVTDGDLLALLITWPHPSRGKKKSTLNGLFVWALRQGLIERNPVDLLPDIKKPAAPVYDVFDANELAAIRQATRDSLLPLTNLIRVELLAHGIRKGGALGLQLQHIDLRDRQMLVTEKGTKSRLVPIRGDVIRHLDQYLMEPYPLLDRSPEPDDFVFFPHGATGTHPRHERAPQLLWLDPTRPLSSTGYQRWWEKTVAAGRVRYRKGHMMRHTYATDATEAEVDLVSLKDMLGHESLSSTLVYVHSSTRRLDKAADKLERYRREAEDGTVPVGDPANVVAMPVEAPSGIEPLGRSGRRDDLGRST